MSAKSDQVFQLSLTEIWIILCFILLLLMGYKVWDLNHKNKDMAEKIANSQDLEAKMLAIKAATSELKARLTTLGVKNPDDVISKLIDASKAKEEAGRLKVMLTQKDEQLSLLMAVDKALQETGGNNKSDDAKRLIIEALLTYDELKKLLADQSTESKDQSAALIKRAEVLKANERRIREALGLQRNPTAEEVDGVIKDAAAYKLAEKDSTNPATLQKINSDLKGQIQFLQNKLNKGKGGDLPPCWANEGGKAEMFLTVYLKENTLSFEPAWPPSRKADAEALPNFNNLMSSSTRTYEDFIQAARAISDLANQHECKFYVRLASQIQDAVTSDRRRLMIENLFYKVEIRR
jgi:hypothetical protein